jgi:transcriptional regulator with XRE-family HTH domain
MVGLVGGPAVSLRHDSDAEPYDLDRSQPRGAPIPDHDTRRASQAKTHEGPYGQMQETEVPAGVNPALVMMVMHQPAIPSGPDRPCHQCAPAGGWPSCEPDESIGALLTRIRLDQGKSQLRLAELLCAASGMATVTRHEVSRWEREARIPSRYWLRWLALVLDIPLHDLEVATARARCHGRASRGERGRHLADGDRNPADSRPWFASIATGPAVILVSAPPELLVHGGTDTDRAEQGNSNDSPYERGTGSR